MTKPFLVVILLVGLGLLAGCRGSESQGSGQNKNDPSEKAPQRIVSMAPSLTEVLFKLDLGDRVVGVSRYCKYPTEAKERTKVGGLNDPNVEQILALEPDLVLMLEGEGNQARSLERLGLPVFLVDHRSIDGVIQSFKTIGKRCGVPEKGEKLAADLTARLDCLRKKNANVKRPRTLICVGRTLGTGRLENLYVAGNNPFFNEALSVAGGKNVMADSPSAFPAISIEGVLQTDPEVIFDMSPMAASSEADREKLMEDWKTADVQAITNGRVHLLDDDYALVPGPRFMLLLEKLDELLHEE
ncbi:MAG: cobalamin-binding protein [Planctomycetia bacterium]